MDFFSKHYWAAEPWRRIESAWLEGLTLIGKDAVIPPRARVGRAAVVGIGASPEELGEDVAAGAVIASRAWYEDVVE